MNRSEIACLPANPVWQVFWAWAKQSCGCIGVSLFMLNQQVEDTSSSVGAAHLKRLSSSGRRPSAKYSRAQSWGSCGEPQHRQRRVSCLRGWSGMIHIGMMTVGKRLLSTCMFQHYLPSCRARVVQLHGLMGTMRVAHGKDSRSGP